MCKQAVNSSSVLLGGARWNAFSYLEYASSARLAITFFNSPSSGPAGAAEHQRKAALWTAGFLDRLEFWRSVAAGKVPPPPVPSGGMPPSNVSFGLSCQCEELFSREINSEYQGAVSLILGSIALIIAFLIVALIRFRETLLSTLVYSKAMLGLCGILATLLALTATLGIFSLAGVKINPIAAQVLPFFVFGIALDNVFVMIAEYERAEKVRLSLSFQSLVVCCSAGLKWSKMLTFFFFFFPVQAIRDMHTSSSQDDDASRSKFTIITGKRIAFTMQRAGLGVALSSMCMSIACGLGSVQDFAAVRTLSVEVCKRCCLSL
jgi:hypothetical protein